MTPKEDIALQLTLSAMETIKLNSKRNQSEPFDSDSLAKDISNFYNSIYTNIKTKEDEPIFVQT